MSDVLVEPYFVRFHSTAGEETGLAFPFLVVHEKEDDHVDGWVFCNDERNDAGLSQGLNWRDKIGHGGPSANVSFSRFDEEV